MEFNVVCSNDGSGCEWSGSLHELEDHAKCCTHRPSQCLYCQTLFPYNTLEEHSMLCLSSKFESLLKLEESVSISLKPRGDDIVLCPNADKHCSWEGRQNDLQAHLYICDMEENKPSRPKRFRFRRLPIILE